MFTLQLLPTDTTTLVLNQETELSGISLITKAQECLKIYIPASISKEHQILGSLPTYTIQVPYDIALTSGLFNNSDNVTITVSENILADYIFYVARIDYMSGRTLQYPYYSDKLVLVSKIDEISFLNDWVSASYANPYIKP